MTNRCLLSEYSLPNHILLPTFLVHYRSVLFASHILLYPQSVCVDLIARTSKVLRTMRKLKIDQIAIVDKQNILCGRLRMRDLIAFSAASFDEVGQDTKEDNLGTLGTVLGSNSLALTGLEMKSHDALGEDTFILAPQARDRIDRPTPAMLARSAMYTCKVSDTIFNILKRFHRGNLTTMEVVNDRGLLLGQLHVDDVLKPLLNSTMELLPSNHIKSI